MDELMKCLTWQDFAAQIIIPLCARHPSYIGISLNSLTVFHAIAHVLASPCHYCLSSLSTSGVISCIFRDPFIALPFALQSKQIRLGHLMGIFWVLLAMQWHLTDTLGSNISVINFSHNLKLWKIVPEKIRPTAKCVSTTVSKNIPRYSKLACLLVGNIGLGSPTYPW